MVRMLVCLCCFFTATAAYAGKYNPVLDIGDKAPSWTKLPGVDSQRHSLADLKESQQVLVIFTCNSCPYAVDYEDRIIELGKQLKELNVALVAINVNKNSEDNLAAMKIRARDKKFDFPYLFDETQKIARDFGATYTPECFLLDEKKRIAYMGALDDNPVAQLVKEKHVLNAVHALQARKQPNISETVAIGCRIRLERRRQR